MRYKSFILLQLIFLLLSCKNNDESNEKEVFDFSNESTFNESKDSDLTSSQFETVKIGNLEWASKNLNVSTFRNGDTIFHAKSNEDWERASKLHIPAYCYYENNPSDEVINPATGQLEENVTKAVAIFKSHQVKVVDAVLFDGGLDDWRFENGGKIKN